MLRRRGRGRRGLWRQASTFEVFARHLASSWGELVQHGGQRIAQRLGRSLLGLQHINAGSQCGRVTRGRLKLRGQALHKRVDDPGIELREGLRVERIPVFPGGVAIMSAIFAEFNIERMVYSEGALRLGVLYDQLGRFHHQDMRDSTVHQFMRRYQVDALQADRVKRTALGLLGQMIQLDAPEHEAEVNFLHWAASLHEIGISIALSTPARFSWLL